eukprot:scaffold95791_cov28-Tisochrysis_lutea.AAC.2
MSTPRSVSEKQRGPIDFGLTRLLRALLLMVIVRKVKGVRKRRSGLPGDSCSLDAIATALATCR